MNSKKEHSQKQILRLRQKTKLRLVIAGSCVFALCIILLIYFNIAQVKEMKAGSSTTNVPVERPVEMNVNQIKIDSSSTHQNGVDYKIAKPLQQAN
jgi:hypothetical protein